MIYFSKISFKYKKDTVTELFQNGRLQFFINHNEELKDEESNSVFKIGKYSIKFFLKVSFDLQPGIHDFLWQYTKYYDSANIKTKQSKIIIEYIEIEGVEYADYECKPCINKMSPVGSSDCYFCKPNQFYDKSNVFTLINHLFRAHVTNVRMAKFLFQTPKV